MIVNAQQHSAVTWYSNQICKMLELLEKDPLTPPSIKFQLGLRLCSALSILKEEVDAWQRQQENLKKTQHHDKN